MSCKKGLCIFMVVCAIGLTGCGGQKKNAESLGEEQMVKIPREDDTGLWSENMQMLKEAVADTLKDNYWPKAPLGRETIEDEFGISGDLYTDYMAEGSALEEERDMLLIFQTGGDYGNQIENALTTYHEKMLTDITVSPVNAVKLEGSRIERIGDYVCYVQLGGNIGEISDADTEEMVLRCREQNELAIAVLEKQLIH